MIVRSMFLRVILFHFILTLILLTINLISEIRLLNLYWICISCTEITLFVLVIVLLKHDLIIVFSLVSLGIYLFPHWHSWIEICSSSKLLFVSSNRYVLEIFWIEDFNVITVVKTIEEHTLFGYFSFVFLILKLG